MTQGQLARCIGCSVETIRKIEKGRIALSEELAHKTSVATGVAKAWLLRNKLDAPPVASRGAPYTREHFDEAQVAGKKQLHPIIGQYFSLALYARIRAILAAAAKRGHSDTRMAHYKLDALLTELECAYGWDEEIYPAQLTKVPNFLSALKLARADLDAFEAELRKPDDAPDRVMSSAWLSDHQASIEVHEHAKMMKAKSTKD